MLIFRDWAYDVALLLARRHRMMTKCEIAERLGNLDIQGSRRRSGASRENGAKRLSLKRFMKPQSINVTWQSGRRSPLPLGVRSEARPDEK